MQYYQYMDTIMQRAETATARVQVDVMKTVAAFDVKERPELLGNLVGIENTLGCGGNCQDCYLMAPPGVYAEITPESNEEMLKAFGNEINQHTFLYYANDLLDHRRASEIYNQFLTHRSDLLGVNTIVTRFPKGSEHELAKIIALTISNGLVGNRMPTIRLSLRGLTQEQREREKLMYMQRLRAVQLEVSLLLGPAYEQDVNNFFHPKENTQKGGIRFLPTSAGRIQAGRRFSALPDDGFDKIRDIDGAAFLTGTVLCPSGFRGVAATAMSPFNVRGEMSWPISAREGYKVPEAHISLTAQSYADAIKEDAYNPSTTPHEKPIMVPAVVIIRHPGRALDELVSPGSGFGNTSELYKETLPSLPRDVLSFRRFVRTMANIPKTALEGQYAQNGLLHFLDQARAEYLQRRALTDLMIDTPGDAEHEYFRVIARTYVEVMDFIFSEIVAITTRGINAQEILDLFRFANNLRTSDLEQPLLALYQRSRHPSPA